LFSIRRKIYPFVVPILLIILSAITIWKWPDLTRGVKEFKELKALFIILPIMPYAIFSIGILMGLRYNNSGLILSSFSLALSYFALSRCKSVPLANDLSGVSFYNATALLLPLNIAFFSMLTKRRIFTSIGVLSSALVMLQIFAVALLCHWPGSPGSSLLPIINEISAPIAKKLADISIKLHFVFQGNYFYGFENSLILPIFAFCGASVFFLIRFLFYQDVMLTGFAGALVAIFIGTTINRTPPSLMVYFSAGGLILIITIIEASFSMAYIDELTGIQGRRSLNEALMNLGHKYAIAMIDVDHFKKFNDTYGHKTGDQVLKMIASKLEKISGGAKIFRYGGEEFAAIFPGKSAAEAQPHLEKYRQSMASTPFIVRSKHRRNSKPKNSGRLKLSGQKQVQVTVSIGVAGSDKNLVDPEKVLKSADKILYKAKKAGRNRVMR